VRRFGPRPLLGAAIVAAGCASPPSPSAPVEPVRPAETAAPVAANAAPEVSGDLLCIGPIGRRHVYPLRLADPEGGPLSFRAEAVEPHGELYPRAASGLASPADIEIVYEPPANRADENVIVLTVADSRGATTTVRLIARSG